MYRILAILLAAMLASAAAVAEEAAVDELQANADTREQDDQPKTLSGMSILGNEEAPKALVIVPWKSSEIGDDIDLSDSLDERARPVDKDVFLRELRFHEIRSGK